MAKKKKVTKPSVREYSSSPFSNLKGLSVSGEDVKKEQAAAPIVEPPDELSSSFADQMTSLGVERLNSADDTGDELSVETVPAVEEKYAPPEPTEEAEFLEAMGELQVSFSDHIPAEDVPPTASARRIKQLKQGKLVPEETLDLHGLQRAEVAEKLLFFLQAAVRQGYQTVLVVTGRGLHSVDGEPVLRSEAERFLSTEGCKWVAEWARAPRQYGGAGALVLFLRKRPK